MVKAGSPFSSHWPTSVSFFATDPSKGAKIDARSIWSSIILGFIISFPYVLWEIWRFISPGLLDNERKKSRGFIFWASFL